MTQVSVFTRIDKSDIIDDVSDNTLYESKEPLNISMIYSLEAVYIGVLSSTGQTYVILWVMYNESVLSYVKFPF